VNTILDACAMIAYLQDEPGSEVVAGLLSDPAETCYAHAVNLCEVYYDFLRNSDEPGARQAIRDLDADGLVERADMGRFFWRSVRHSIASSRSVSA
jgi:PIN domain nuclease of toxin-antitoxin system